MRPNTTIAIIILYFGKLPWYFDYFIHSCKYNKSIDFIIISDACISVESLPQNVFTYYYTLEDLTSFITKRLRMKIALAKPYKLCDFRPAYGVIFKKLLMGYAFWGHADIDVIFGNIRKFVTPEMLKSYDIITLRHDYLLGCFTIYKNVNKINLIFKKNKDYKKVFADAKHYCFDETNFHHGEFLKSMHYSEIKSDVESMTHLVKRLDEAKYIKAYFDFHIIEGIPGNLKWHKGRLIYDKRFEVALYHLVHFKNVVNSPQSPIKIRSTFYISDSQICFC